MSVISAFPGGGKTVLDGDTATSLNGLLKGNGSKVSVAAAGTDYAPPAQAAAVNLPLSGWTQNEASVTQTVTVTGMTATTNIIVSPDPDSFSDWSKNKVRCAVQGYNALTFQGDTMPESDLTANVLIVG